MKDKHVYLITNVFYTLMDSNIVDVIKTCGACNDKQAMSMDRQTLIEVAQKFPNAFEETVREYISSWIP